MDAVGTFDRLVAELSVGERRELFRKLESSAPLSMTPLFREEELPERVELEHRYRDAPLLLRLFIRVLCLFKGRPPLKVFEDHLIAKIGTAIEARYPGLFDRRRTLLTAGFREELESLKYGARIFYDALDAGLVRDKGSFFAFLASFELEGVHKRLIAESDPYACASVESSATESEVRQAIYRAVDTILASIDDEERAVMYRNVRSLFCLRELSSFLYDRAIGSFSGTLSEASCPAYLLADQLTALNDILRSFDAPPSMRLLESLFIFEAQDRLGSPDFDLVQETKKRLSLAEDALTRIRLFNQRVPLTAILRCVSRNVSYLPSVITGGEDWFVIYRDFWKKRTEDLFASFVKDRRRGQLEETLTNLFGGRPFPTLRNAQSSASPDSVPVRLAFSLGFLLGFAKYVFLEDVNRPLKTLLIDGEFYKKDNRLEFTDSYNELLKLGDAITAFDAKLAVGGEYGQRYDQTKKEIVALPLKRRKNQALLQEVDAEGAAIVDRAGRAFRSLSAVIGGILHGEVGGKYDSLSNLGLLAGRMGNSAFISSLRNALQKIDKAVQILGEIESVESGR